MSSKCLRETTVAYSVPCNCLAGKMVLSSLLLISGVAIGIVGIKLKATRPLLASKFRIAYFSIISVSLLIPIAPFLLSGVLLCVLPCIVREEVEPNFSSKTGSVLFATSLT